MSLRDKMTGPTKEQVLERFKNNGMSDDLISFLSNNDKAYRPIANLLADKHAGSSTIIGWINDFYNQLITER